MQVFALGGPQGNTGQKSVLVKKPVSRKFIELSSLEILFFAGSLLHALIINIFYYSFFVFFVIYVWENTPVYELA